MRRFSPEELADIRRSYANAASRKKQIGILADLYACPRQDIERALGLPVTPMRAAPPRRPPLRWTPEMEARLLVLYDRTHDTAVIAADMGLHRRSVNCKIRKLTATGRIAPALSGCAKEAGKG